MSAELKEYTFRTRWSEEDGKWLGQCPAFMQLAAYGDSPQEALQGIMDLVRARITSGEKVEEKSVFKSMDDMLSGAPGPLRAVGRMKPRRSEPAAGSMHVVVSPEAYTHAFGPDNLNDHLSELEGTLFIYIGCYKLDKQLLAVVVTPRGMRDLDWGDFNLDTEPLGFQE